MRAALVCLSLMALEVAADYMYRAPPHLLHGPPPHKHHLYGKSPGGGPGKLMHTRPPTPYYHRPHHRVRKPPPPPPPPTALGSLSGHNPWKMSPYKTPKDPFRSHGSEPDFGSHAAVLSALKQPSPVSHGAPMHVSYTNIVSDDRGPIHTIPAPNLSPADRPSHLDSSSFNSVEQQAIRSALSQLGAAKPATVHHSQGYQVSEPQSQQHLYAPDPDPSRPAPKLRPSTDPHSLPSEGRGPHFSIDPQFGAIATQPGYISSSAGAALSPQDLFHLLNGFPLQHDMQPQLQILHPGLQADTSGIEQQQILLQHQQQHLQQLQQQHLQQQHLQQQQLQQQQLQQQLEAESHSQQYYHQQPSLRQLSHQDFQPQFQSFNYDEQSYQKSLFQGDDQDHDHEGSEDAPRPSVQMPPMEPQTAKMTQEEPSSVTVTLPMSSTPMRPDTRPQGDQPEDDLPEDYEDVLETGDKYRSTSAAQEVTVTTASPPEEPSEQEIDEDDERDAAQRPVVVRDESPFRRQPNSVHVPENKPGHHGLPYGARIRPKRTALP